MSKCCRRSRRLALAVLVAVSSIALGCTVRPQPEDMPSSGSSLSTVAPAPVASSGQPPDYRVMKQELQRRLASDDDWSLKAVRAVLVSVDGDLVLSYYRNRRPTDYAVVHSVTKSVVSILVGIAVDEGRLRLDQTLAELLPTYADEMTDQVKSVTLHHLLTMTSGAIRSDDGGRPLHQRVEDPVRLILNDGFVGEPGAAFVYSDLGAHLVGVILREAVDRPILDYAREKLFDPLGIDTRPAWQGWSPDFRAALNKPGFAWGTDREGTNSACCLLKLRAPDMVKIGQLYLDEGRWQGRQLVSPGWVKKSTTDQLTKDQATAEGGYGYFWWVSEIEAHYSFAARGAYGQYIIVVPDSRLIVVTASDDSGFPDPTVGFHNALSDVIFAPILHA